MAGVPVVSVPGFLGLVVRGSVVAVWVPGVFDLLADRVLLVPGFSVLVVVRPVAVHGFVVVVWGLVVFGPVARVLLVPGFAGPVVLVVVRRLVLAPGFFRRLAVVRLGCHVPGLFCGGRFSPVSLN